MKVNYFSLFLKAIVFALICLALKTFFNSVARAEFYEFPDYYNTPATQQNVYVPSNTYNPHLWHNDFDNHTGTPTPVYEIQTGVPNTTLTHPVDNPFTTPQPTYTIKRD